MSRALTILVSDYDEVSLRFVELVLLRAGYLVLSAANAEQALQLCAGGAETIDLALLDPIMPARDGSPLRGRLREIYPNLPFLFLSGHDEEELNRQGAGDVSAGDLLKKPFTSGQLLHRVRRITGRPRTSGA